MKKEDLRIVFMGTPDFAVESLRCLVEGGYNIVGVVTMPDKPIGRHGSVLQASPVKEYAVSQDLLILQPDKLKAPEFVEKLQALHADLQIVVAFRMLPEIVWSMPRLGTFNLHASLLPQYRGAAPINWAVINGETETGITTFFLRHEIDTGEIIQQVHVPISLEDNVGDVHDRLMLLGGKLVIETVDNIISGNISTIDQDEIVSQIPDLHPAPKIFHETCMINWNQPVRRIYDFVRGLSPYPAAWSQINGTQMKIYKASMSNLSSHELQPGEIRSDGKTYIRVATSDCFLSLETIQLAGKKRMDVQDFLRGFHLSADMRMG